EVAKRRRIEQLAQLLLAEQLAEEVAVEREGLCPALGERRVALVHVGGHVVEQQGTRERRRARRLHGVKRALTALAPSEPVAQRRQVEDVGKALAVRLHEDREGPVTRRHGQEVRRALTLLPERGSRPGPASRQEQRASRVLAEPRGEE